MPLFQKKTIEPEPPRGGGKDVLRAKVRAYNRGPVSISLLKEELHVWSGVLEAFGAGADNLSDLQIEGVLRYFGWTARYNSERDVLVSLGEPARSLGVGPPPSPVNLPVGFVLGKAGDPPPLFKTPLPAPRLRGYEQSKGWG